MYLNQLKCQYSILILLAGSKLAAQPNSQIKNVDQLTTEKKVVVENYPNIFKEEEINKVEKIDEKHSKVYYTRNHVKFEAVVNSNREELLLIAIFEQVPSTRLPAIVLDNFYKNLDGNEKIQNAFIGTTPSSSDFYRIDFYDKNEILKNAFYDHLGRYMKPPY